MTKSRSVELLGEQAPPRHLVRPSDARSNAWEDVAALSASFGVTLYPWQELMLKAAMGERADGRWAAQQVAMSVPRQNGKSQLIVARALAGALLFGERLIVISAHQQDTARETFSKLQEQIDASDALQARIAQVMTALNREFVKFKNGAVIKFKARSGSGGRGFSSDCLMLDEAQILSARAWASIRPTMSARRNPQVWLLGTPPTPEDDGEVFGRIRQTAIDGKTSRVTYGEWSADPDADPALEETRASANPAWFDGINHEIVQGEYESMTPEQFALERLGIWPAESLTDRPLDRWAACVDAVSQRPAGIAFGFSVLPDLTGARIAVVGRRPDGRAHGEIVEMSDGTSTLVARLLELCERWKPCAVAMNNAGAARAFLPMLMEAGIVPDPSPSQWRLQALGATEYAAACVALSRDVIEDRFRHPEDPVTNMAALGVRKRALGQGWAFVDRTGLIEAMALAHHGFATSAAEPARPAPFFMYSD